MICLLLLSSCIFVASTVSLVSLLMSTVAAPILVLTRGKWRISDFYWISGFFFDFRILKIQKSNSNFFL
jgi:hypothetical protein